MLFELLMAVFMEKHTPKSSANSSLPASQSPNDDTARTRPGAKGKGPSSNGERCANTRTREYVKVLSVDACGRCGEDLTDAACTGRERRTLIDIVFEKVVRHADAQIKHCPRCHAETRACFPHQMPGPLQYGPGIKAYVVHLLIAQMLSLKRVAQSMHALIGRTSPRPRSSATSHSSITRSPNGSTTPSSACSPHRRCTSTRPRCAWTARITGFMSSATRQGWSRRIGVCDDFMKPCLSSSGCETRPAKGEPARPVASLAPETVTDSAMRRYANEWAVSHAATKGICFPGCPGC